MNWTGKIIGIALGLLSRRWYLVLLGFFLGHLYDLDLFRKKPDPGIPPATAPPGDPYAVLGIASDATDDELEQAYRRLMSEYHPDRVANAAKEIRDMADVRSREINQAYDQIKRQRGL